MANGVGIGGNGKSPAIDKINRVSNLDTAKLQVSVMETLVLSRHSSSEVSQDKGGKLKNETAMEENDFWIAQPNEESHIDVNDTLSSEEIEQDFFQDDLFSGEPSDEGFSYFSGNSKNEKKKEMGFGERLTQQLKDFGYKMNQPPIDSALGMKQGNSEVREKILKPETLRMDELKRKIDQIGISFKDV